VRAAAQLERLQATLQPAVFEDIEGVSPRQGWVPLELVEAWLNEALNAHYGRVRLVRQDGLVQVPGVDYDDLDEAALSADARWCVGWINHDKTVFKPSKRRDENIDEVRLKHAAAWEQAFRDWCGATDARRSKVEAAYNRAFRGFVAPDYSAEHLPIARWSDAVRLHPHQVAGARRLLANRGGLLAFDVGVGKTYTGLAVLARARQEGWCRRPVVVVPNSIAWKWAADVARVLPDYRVVVIGSNRMTVQRGRPEGPRDLRHRHPRRARGQVDPLPGWRVRRRPAHVLGVLPLGALPRSRDPLLPSAPRPSSARSASGSATPARAATSPSARRPCWPRAWRPGSPRPSSCRPAGSPTPACAGTSSASTC
jgi:hypothetical protein